MNNLFKAFERHHDGNKSVTGAIGKALFIETNRLKPHEKLMHIVLLHKCKCFGFPQRIDTIC